MIAALETAWDGRATDETRMKLTVEVVHPDRSKIRLERGVYRAMSESALPKKLSAPINAVLRPLREKWVSFLDGRTRFTVSVDQQIFEYD